MEGYADGRALKAACKVGESGVEENRWCVSVAWEWSGELYSVWSASDCCKLGIFDP